MHVSGDCLSHCGEAVGCWILGRFGGPRERPDTGLWPKALHIEKARGFWGRALGLHAYGVWGSAAWGLLLQPCRLVHTLGMRQAIDVVFLDRAGRIITFKSALPPNRLCGCRHAYAVLELPAGYCRQPAWRERVLQALADSNMEV